MTPSSIPAGQPTFLSLFAGIGGLDLGLERAGWRCIGQVEIDPYCRKVLAKHWPDVKRMEDVRDVKEDSFEKPDLFCGGFPCQDISLAGDRAGIDGARSGLWAEFSRLIREIRPRFSLVENVAALLVCDEGKSAPIARVLGDLAEIGFDAEWHGIPASYLGAPHIRDRVFIIANTNQSRRIISDDASGRIHAEKTPLVWESFGTTNFAIRVQELARICSDDDGLPEELGAYGNAVVPQVAEYIGRAILAAREAA